MLSLLFAGEQPPEDPLWLRTMATILPFLGPVVVGLIAAPWLAEKWKDNKHKNNTPTPGGTPVVTGGGLPAPVALEAVQRAQVDPLLTLFIQDLHGRLSAAHDELAVAHTQRVADATTIAALTAEVEDQSERYQECMAELEKKDALVRLIRPQLEQLKFELEQTRRKLAICMEGYVPPND